jgi:hypothetical protein
MSLQFSTELRNAKLDAIETYVGESPILKILTGARPTYTTSIDAGTVLVTMILPVDWMSAASGGTKSKSGSWKDLSADATGVAGHFRIFKADGTTCVMQGTVTATGNGGDMTMADISIVQYKMCSVTGFSLTEGNSA